MQIAQERRNTTQGAPSEMPEESSAVQGSYAEFRVIRRNGAVVSFEPGKISIAMTKAFLAVSGSQAAASARIREVVPDGRRTCSWPTFPTC